MENLVVTMTAEVWRAVQMLITLKTLKKRNLQMPGQPRYQPKALRPYFGYDQWAGWLILVEWFWMKTLHRIGVMPDEDAAYLTDDLLRKLLTKITTTLQDQLEADTKHDIIALLILMREILPLPLHRWLHYCATSYDIISTAYALQYRVAYLDVIHPKAQKVDKLWRDVIGETAEKIQLARTHLVTALPTTFGCSLTPNHNRLARNTRQALACAYEAEGKFSGATGTHSSQIALIGHSRGEEVLMEMIGLKRAPVSTQIAPPESLQNCYHALMLMSGALGNLGEDARMWQAIYKELVSASSTSSAMSNKRINPIAAEQLVGMHRLVVNVYELICKNMISDFQRDLTGSSCMRAYAAGAVYTYQMLVTAERWFNNLQVKEEVCAANFRAESPALTAEILHLSLGDAGLPEAHKVVNEHIIPLLDLGVPDLYTAVEQVIAGDYESPLGKAWCCVPEEVKGMLSDASKFTGNAVSLARSESLNAL